jgi:hypothetical protein
VSGGSKSTTTQNSNTNSTQATQSQAQGASATGSSSTSTPIAPDDWQAFWQSLMPASGGTGLTPDQQAAAASLRGNVGGAAANPGLSLLQAAANGNTAYGSTYTIQQLQKQWPDLYKAIAPVTAGTVTAPTVSAGTGADFMGAYANPFEDQVVGSTLDDLSRAYGQTRNARASQLQAAGAFGGSASRLNDSLDQQNYLRAVASTAGNLRSQGFNAAAALGQSDATRDLTGQQSNQGTSLDASKANQGTALTAAIQNQNNQTGQQEFDVNAAYKGQDTRNAAAQNYAQTIAQAFGIDNETAMSLINSGVIGNNQNLAWLNAGRPLFGQSNSGVSVGNTSQNGTSASQGSSNSSGTSTTQTQPGLLDILGALGPLISGLGNLGWNPFGGGGGGAGSSILNGGGFVPMAPMSPTFSPSSLLQ